MSEAQLEKEKVMKSRHPQTSKTDSGFSAVELIIVVALIAILSAMSLPYIFNYKKAYKSEDQALKVIDLMRETGQLALTRRRPYRFEIDLTDNAVLIIDESHTVAGVVIPDTQIKKIPMELPKDVRMDIIPAGVTKPNPPNYTDFAFAVDAKGHLVGSTTITGHTVWVARFASDGSVLNNANIPINANIYIWPPISYGSTTPRNKAEVKAITMFGGSGAIRYWKHDGTSFVANQ